MRTFVKLLICSVMLLAAFVPWGSVCLCPSEKSHGCDVGCTGSEDAHTHHLCDELVNDPPEGFIPAPLQAAPLPIVFVEPIRPAVPHKIIYSTYRPISPRAYKILPLRC